jgi:chemotaxis protein MotB
MNFNSHSSGSGPSHERWLVSYADFVTLLLAVFVVLFTSANSGKNRAKEISAAVVEALTNGAIRIKTPHSGKPGTAAQNQANQAVPLESSLKVLTEQLRREIEQGRLSVRMEPRGLVISLSQAAFFGSGQSAINQEMYPTADRIAKVIAAVPNQVRLEGHTDAVPIRNSRYSSNWELSAARSIAVLQLFVDRNRIPIGRLSIAGFADTEPLGSNDSEEGRAHNRRVDVVILNEVHNGNTSK